MALPNPKEARIFYRCAKQRFDDAVVLHRADHSTGAVYLAGYGIECILKALLLSNLAAREREQMLGNFRGNWGHSYNWLREQCLAAGKVHFPMPINRAFLLVGDWSTDLRYMSGKMSDKNTDAFLDAAKTIIVWADGRM
jgi:hypothetical protein